MGKIDINTGDQGSPRNSEEFLGESALGPRVRGLPACPASPLSGWESEVLPGTSLASGPAMGTGPSSKPPGGAGQAAVSQMVMRLVGTPGQGWHQLPGRLLGAVPQAGLQQEKQVSHRVLGTHVCAGAKNTRMHV